MGDLISEDRGNFTLKIKEQIAREDMYICYSPNCYHTLLTLHWPALFDITGVRPMKINVL